MTDYENYLSPFSWRYGSNEMRQVWSEAARRRLWRRVWVALARAQSEFGLVRPDQLADLEAHVEQVDLPRALEIEAEIHHDLMAELKTFAEQATTGGAVLHLGATSMDIEDNAEALRLREAQRLLLDRLASLLRAFAGQIERTAALPVIAFTHLQPAEPTSLGYRLAFTARELLESWQRLSAFAVQGKGFKGAVGTAAAYYDLMRGENFAAFEKRLSELLGIPFYPVTHQTYPRIQEYDLLCLLARIGASLYKFAFDLRLLQSPVIGEAGEPFGRRQVGSSAMPFKRNPIQSEKIDSLARALAQAPLTAWQNAAHSLLERTLDDSANRRSLLPEAFLACEELLLTAGRIVSHLDVRPDAIARNLERYAPFAGTERVLMATVRAGADRQAMHERLRELSMQAWAATQQGEENPLVGLLAGDALIAQYLGRQQLAVLLDVRDYLGIAPEQARATAQDILRALDDAPPPQA